MGAVYLAHDLRLNRQVALKLFSGDAAQMHYARHDLFNEARAAAALNHPHIASVYDVLDVDGQVAIVFEYVEGETLAERLRRGPVAVDGAVAIARQLADALASAHAQGIVHRDLKPANIVVRRGGVVKVLDFGVARMTPQGVSPAHVARTTASRFIGTIGYASPEQCLGQSVDARSDIYSLGVVLFEMITGRRLFTSDEAPAVVQAMLSGPAPRVRSVVRDVPVEIDELVSSMLAIRAVDRPATAADVRDRLRERAALASGSRRAAKMPRGAWAAVAALLVAVSAGIAALLWPGSAPQIDAKPPVVAVLPLTNASGDPANAYVAVGVADSLVTRLAAIPAVTVLSRSAVSTAASGERNISALASELDANFLIDGSVQQVGDTLRISLNLIREDASVAWADTVEGSFRSVFDLQARLASMLAQALAVQLSAADRASLVQQPTTNSEALAAYWRGRAFLERRDIRGNVDAARRAFNEAVQHDPSYADAHAALGEAQWVLYQEQRDPALAKAAIDAGHTALRLDPRSAQVRYVLAVTLAGTGRLDEAADELQRALALRANFDDARSELGAVLARQGKLEEAVAEMRKAIALRPNFWGHYSTLGVHYFRAAKYEEAAAAFARVIELQPDNFIGYQQLGSALQVLGRDREALENYEVATQIRPSATAFSNIGTLHYRAGDYGKALAAYRESAKLRPNNAITQRNLGDTFARLGRTSEAGAAYREAARLAERDLAVNPKDAGILAAAAVYAAKAGDVGRARQRLAQALASAPADVQVLYRSAVVHALLNEQTPALDALEAAVKAGYSKTEIRQEEDFASLRRSARFQALVQLPASGGLPQ
jgi:serine/threonine-protein kinase